MVKPISFEHRERAEKLYIHSDLTLDEVAAETGISVQSLKRWSSTEDWFARRKDYQRKLAEIEEKTIDLKLTMIREGISSKDPQVVHAGNAIKIKEYINKMQQVQVDRPRLFLEAMQFTAAVLREIDPEAFRGFARNFDLIINRFKNEHAQA